MRVDWTDFTTGKIRPIHSCLWDEFYHQWLERQEERRIFGDGVPQTSLQDAVVMVVREREKDGFACDGYREREEGKSV